MWLGGGAGARNWLVIQLLRVRFPSPPPHLTQELKFDNLGLDKPVAPQGVELDGKEALISRAFLFLGARTLSKDWRGEQVYMGFIGNRAYVDG